MSESKFNIKAFGTFGRSKVQIPMEKNEHETFFNQKASYKYVL